MTDDTEKDIRNVISRAERALKAHQEGHTRVCRHHLEVAAFALKYAVSDCTERIGDA